MFERLEYLAEAYFHQDYDLLGPTPAAVVYEFCKREAPQAVSQLQSDVDSALQTLTEQELASLWLERWRASYDPRQDQMTYRQWFQQILHVLREQS